MLEVGGAAFDVRSEDGVQALAATLERSDVLARTDCGWVLAPK